MPESCASFLLLALPTNNPALPGSSAFGPSTKNEKRASQPGRSKRSRSSGPHKEKKRLQCDKCPKTFSKHNHLTRHALIHTGDKPFCCSICDKRYLRMSDLKVHLRSHTGERPYGCTKCGKRYITSSHLKTHERTHNDDVRSYACPACAKTFSSKNGERSLPPPPPMCVHLQRV